MSAVPELGQHTASGTGTQAVGQPGKKRVEKPPTIDGYSWRDDGAGWQLRQSVVVDGERKRPYVAHLSKSAYRDLKRQHKGQALADALAQWVKDREREKGE